MMPRLDYSDSVGKLRSGRALARGDIDRLLFLVRQASLYIEMRCSALEWKVSGDVRAAFNEIDQLAKFIFETSDGIGVLLRFPSESDPMKLSYKFATLPSLRVADNEDALLELEREFIVQDDAFDWGADIDRWEATIGRMIAIETRSLAAIRAKARLRTH